MTFQKAYRSPLTIIQAMEHPGLFQNWFNGPSWDGWKAIKKAQYCLPMSEDEITFFRSVAGGRDPPKKRVRELWVCGGRRLGKDSMASLDIGFTAALFGDQDKLRRGEKAVALCLACDREQASIVLGYVKSYFQEIAPFKELVARETLNGLELKNGVDIIVATNSYRSIRGRTILLAVFDEVAFWQDETTARPDTKTYDACVPGMATLPGAMLIGISTPHKKSGLLFNKWKQFFGKDDDRVLVIQSPSTMLNPTLDPKIIAQAYEDDPIVAAAEWGGEWRDDVNNFLTTELLDACTDRGVTVREPVAGTRYFGFVDASSGSGKDSFAVGIAHSDGDKPLLDVAHEIRPPFSPSNAIAEVAELLKSYRIHVINGDKYAAGFVIDGFAKHGIRYEYSEHDRSEVYLEALPLLTSGRARLLENKRLVAQLLSLERRTMSTGRDIVDHPKGDRHHDDLANACAGALALAGARKQTMTIEAMQSVMGVMAARGPYRSRYQDVFARDSSMEARLGERRWAQMKRGRRF